MPLVPNSIQPGYLYVSSGTGQNNGRWTPLTFDKEWAVTGTVSATVGATGYLPPWIASTVCQLLSISVQVRSGSLTLDFRQNGTGIAGLTSLSATTTVTSYTPTNTVMVSIGDLLGPFVDTVSAADGLLVNAVMWKYL